MRNSGLDCAARSRAYAQAADALMAGDGDATDVEQRRAVRTLLRRKSRRFARLAAVRMLEDGGLLRGASQHAKPAQHVAASRGDAPAGGAGRPVGGGGDCGVHQAPGLQPLQAPHGDLLGQLGQDGDGDALAVRVPADGLQHPKLIEWGNVSTGRIAFALFVRLVLCPPYVVYLRLQRLRFRLDAALYRLKRGAG